MRIAVLVLLLALPAAADIVYLKGGKKLRGLATKDGGQIVVNPYNSSVPGMKLDVQRIDEARVRKIVRTLPAPRHEFQRRLKEADSARALIDLAAWCATRKLKRERVWALQLALRADPQDATARKLLGSKAPKGNWTAQLELARSHLDAPDEGKRAAARTEIRKDPSFPFTPLYLQRALRSSRQPKGYQKDRPVAVRANKLKTNARYTLFVPKNYDPLAPAPLVIGLHGGGRGGKDGKLVVGSGWQAMSFYRGHCETRGWICACPTALEGGWGNRSNHELIDAVLDELRALYNIDENRIYLVGHSMGGGGTWSQGARLPEVWAAISPCASFGVQGIDRFIKTGTGFYVYHSDDDNRCGVGGVRPRMKNLPGSGADFVYTELSGFGHGFPGHVRDDIFRFFDVRLRTSRKGRVEVRPLSSFLRKVSRDEKRYLPPLHPSREAGDAETGRLLKSLKTGGGVAEQVVPQLIAQADPKLSGRVGRILIDPRSGPDVRRYAARVLGGRKAKDQLKALGRVLLIETDAAALLEALAAIDEIGDAAAGDALLKFLRRRKAYFDERLQGSEIHHSDWATIIPTLARTCILVGSFKPEKGASVIVETVVRGILLSEVRVVFDRVNQRPLPAGRALGTAACGALGQLEDPAALRALEEMAAAAGGASGVDIKRKRGPVGAMGEWPRDARIAGAVREAIEAIKG